MEQLNDNNFLIWKGAFNNVPAELEAVDDTIFMNINEDFATLYPLSNDTSNYGIDYSSFRLTYNDNPSKPARFNHGSGLLKYFPRLPVISGQVRTLKYQWNDIKGNESNEGIVSINITDRPLGWRVVPESGFCVVNANMQNTGYVGYTQIERYYTDDDTAVSPPQVIQNLTSDPNYIAPVINEELCPVGLTNATILFNTEIPYTEEDGYNNAVIFSGNQVFYNSITGVEEFNIFINGLAPENNILREIDNKTYNITFAIDRGSLTPSLSSIKIVDNQTNEVIDTKIIATIGSGTYTFNNVAVSQFGIKAIIFVDTL